jgi:hypothetical protein
MGIAAVIPSEASNLSAIDPTGQVECRAKAAFAFVAAASRGGRLLTHLLSPFPVTVQST